MRKLIFSLVAGAALAGASAANATSFVGSTTGCFGSPCLTGTSATSITGTPVGGGTGGTLTFNSGSFDVTDSGGIAPIGTGLLNDTLGFFSLTHGTATQSTFNTPFTLFVTFTLPAGTAGAGTFMSAITGSVNNGTAGGVDIDFDNTPHLFTSSAGPFTLLVRDLSVTNGGVLTPITGTIRAVPEPATWAMMLLGFGGIGLAMRRRRKTHQLLQIA